MASALGNGVEPVPEGLWSVISSSLIVPDQDKKSFPPSLTVLPHTSTTQRAAGSSAKTPRSRTGRRYLMVVTSVAAAAVAATAVLGVSLLRTTDQNDRLQAQLGTNNSSVVAALETPGHTLVSLRNREPREGGTVRAVTQWPRLPRLLVTAQAEGRPHVPALGHNRGPGDLARPVGSLSERDDLHRRRVGGPESTGRDGGAGWWVNRSHVCDACDGYHTDLSRRRGALAGLASPPASGMTTRRLQTSGAQLTVSQSTQGSE